MKATVGWVHRHRWLSVLIGGLVLAGAGTATYVGVRNDSASASGTTYRTQAVTSGTVKQSVSATGSVAPAKEKQLNFVVAGQVISVLAASGDRVHKHQALARINSASLVAAVAEARATVATAKAKVSSDGSDGITGTQLAADEAAVTAAHNQLRSARRQVADATLRSPIDGVVAAVNLAVGQSVSGTSSDASSSSSSSRTDAQVLVIGTRSWLVDATVDATSVGLIKVADQAQLTITGASETVYGTVSSIALVASESDTGSASYAVVIDVTGSPKGLHDGADVTASVIYRQASGLVVPTQALHPNTDGTQYVEQIKDGKVVKTSVRTGISSDGQTLITSGLAEGDQIRVPALQTLPGGTNSNGQTNTGNFPGGAVIFPGGGQAPGTVKLGG